MDLGSGLASAKDVFTDPTATALHAVLAFSPRHSVLGSYTTGANLTWTLAAVTSWIKFELEVVPPTLS